MARDRSIAQGRNIVQGRGEQARETAATPPYPELFLVNCAIGFAAAAILVFGLIVSDAPSIGPLLMHEPSAAALLWFFSGLTFASAQTGAAIMSIGRSRDDR